MLASVIQVHNEFILPSERDGFIHRMRDIIKRAESLMGKDLTGQHGRQEGMHFAQHHIAGSISSSQVKSECSAENGGFITGALWSKKKAIRWMINDEC